MNPAPDDSPLSFSAWLMRNATSLLFMGVSLALVFIYLNPITVLAVALGLGLVIFIHELGHFVAAKWCDVHVETFSIGFGPALPGCKFQYGETTYMLALVPLGGYVKMVGEGEGAEGEEADEDPRSFKNKSVGQRMLIISAGVIMNIILACICFIFVYTTRGKEEFTGSIGAVDAGSPAWKAGLQTGDVIRQIGSRENPWFDDIRPTVMATTHGEVLPVKVESPRTGQVRDLEIEPWVGKETPYPVIGVIYSYRLTTMAHPRQGGGPFMTGTAASRAEPPLKGDGRIVAMTDPADPSKVTELPPDTRQFPNAELLDPDQRDYFEYLRRLHDLRGKPITLRVVNDGQPVDAVVPPAYHWTFGMRMRMGEVTAVRDNSPAAKAGVQPRSPDRKYPTGDGDRIKQVEVTNADKTVTRYVAAPSSPPKPDEVQLDPLRLPSQLEAWAEKQTTNRTVKVTVLRSLNHKQEEVVLDLTWDDGYRYTREMLLNRNSPMPIDGLGLAYQVEGIIDAVEPGSPAADAGLQPNDVMTEVRFKQLDRKGKVKDAEKYKLEPDQWAAVFRDLQTRESKELELKVKRGNDAIDVTLTAREDTAWPLVERGLLLRPDFRLQKAQGVVQALEMGGRRTVRMITIIYQNLRALVIGRVSPMTMSGPITIATMSYGIAMEDLYLFIFFIGAISVNLAVVNFLPIPVLDGGHMVFLIYEKLRGKPAPESVQVVALYIGLACIASLMLFVIFLDVRRLLL